LHLEECSFSLYLYKFLTLRYLISKFLAYLMKILLKDHLLIFHLFFLHPPRVLIHCHCFVHHLAWVPLVLNANF